MAQLPQDHVSGSSIDTTAAPATLSLADLLQALTLGARLTLGEGSDGQPLSLSLPPPTSPPNTSSSPSTTGAGTGGGPAFSAAISVGSGGISDNTSTSQNAESRSSVAAGKAKATEPDNGPCAMCAARGCLPPPPSEEEEESLGDIDETAGHLTDTSSVRWYIVTVGRRVGVFAGWANVAPLVVRVSGAVYSKCSSRAAAQAAFAAAVEAGAVHVIE